MRPDRFLIILPTRGRRWNALEAIASVMKTASHPERVDLLICQDHDDVEKFELTATYGGWIGCYFWPRRRFVEWINTAWRDGQTISRYSWIAWLGDDVRYLTPGWDEIVSNHKELVVYGRDGHHDEKMATHPFIRAEIPLALGYLIPSELVHLCPDSFIEALAREIGSIAYDPAIHTEHLNYQCGGKAKMDQTYADARAFYESDQRTFDTIIRPRIPALAKQVQKWIDDH